MFKKIFRVIYYVLLGGLATIALLLVFSRFPIAGRLQTLMVLSGSMEPKIKTGSVVLVKGASTYKTGDVVTFKGEGKTPTTHRIVAETDEGFVTRGDANNADDLKKLAPQNILGKALFSIPYLGYLIAWARTTPGLIILIVIPAVIIIYSEALAIQKELKRIIKERREKKIPQTAAVSSEQAMPMPQIKKERNLKIKETAKKTLKASILIFGFLSILNLRTIQGTKAFFADEEKSSGQITAWVDAATPIAPPA
ncbi:signal peptidase I, partial [bacterium (Candidatus Torokbacteria) CG09_land_8_20_14_0_10_42_11]